MKTVAILQKHVSSLFLAVLLYSPFGFSENAACPSVVTNHPRTVTSSFTTASKSINVTQLTSGGPNLFGYYDVPMFLPRLDSLVYFHMDANRPYAGTLRLGAGKSMVIAPWPAIGRVFATPDGEHLYFPRFNDAHNSTWDFYELPVVNLKGDCTTPSRLTFASMPPSSVSDIQMSTTSQDPDGQTVFGYATSAVFTRITAKGAKPYVALTDPESSRPFHRIRLSPTCSNILAYRRQGDREGTPTVWITDLNKRGTSYALWTGKISYGHEIWSRNGRQIGFEAQDGQWLVSNVVKTDCSLEAPKVFQNPRVILPKGTKFSPDYCVWSPSATHFACVGYERLSSGQKRDEIFLLSMNGTASLLTTTEDKPNEEHFEGTPLQFLSDDHHLIFYTNRTGVHEIYMVSGF